MKKVLLYIMVFACFCGFIELSVNYSLGKQIQIQNQSPYCLSFSSIGANLLESRMDSWAKIKTTSSSKELDHNLIEILDHLQLPINNHKFKHINSKAITSLEYECQKSNETFQFILQSDQAQKETYILISIISKENSTNLSGYENKLKSVVDCDCYYLYTGYIDYTITSESQQQLLDLVLKQMDAKRVDTYQQSNTTSITAFSNKLANNVKPVNNGLNKVNLQAAMRSNNIEHRTYIYLGTPVILGEY